ncbi:MAG: hypothetical protein V5A22_10425, partial [Salinivenus sp.]
MPVSGDASLPTDRLRATDGNSVRVALRSVPGGAWAALVLACVGSRLATTITYVEDPDSLRFALSVADEFDVAALQPHFPGYPVFWAVSQLFYLPTGSFSASFSIVGGLATAGLLWALLRLRGTTLRSVEGLALTAVVFFNPLVWLMGNRYMPDLLGTAVALATLSVLVEALRRDGDRARRAAVLGMALAGLLAGLRLSFLPLVLPPALWVLGRVPGRAQQVGTGLLGVLVWLGPMTIDTGLQALLDVAWGQTTGHFTEFGGTVQTEPDLSRRVAGLVQGLWADGLGGWWPGRHPLTVLSGLSVLGTGALGAWRLWPTDGWPSRRAGLIGASVLLYGAWIFLFQNVVHKSRHVLPLLTLLLVLPAAGLAALWRPPSWLRRGALAAALGTYATVTLVLVNQHRSPTAIAQVKTYVEQQTDRNETVRVASMPLVNTYLRRQQVEARYLSVEDSADVRRLRRAETGRTLVVGTYSSLLDREPTATRRFYHNPHVNRMWP